MSGKVPDTDDWQQCLNCLSQLQQQFIAYRKQRFLQRLVWVAIAFASAALTVVLPWQAVAVGAFVFALGAEVMTPTSRRPKPQPDRPHHPAQPEPAEAEVELHPASAAASSTTFDPTCRCYRVQELQRIVASLKADASILVVGEEGSGKTVLADSVVKQLMEEGFVVATIESGTPKTKLKQIAQQLGVPTESVAGKALTIDDLKDAIEDHFHQETAFLVVDDAHRCDVRFRDWLKTLKHRGVPMLLLATDPPRSDIFVSVSRIELAPLAEYAIREVMEQAALRRGLNLKPHDLARLQERTGGNPALAIRAIEDEYLGIEAEAGDHRRYADATPLVLLMGVGFVVIRFIGLGTSNQGLYILGGILAAVFLGVSRVLSSLPKEGRKIQ